MADYDSRSGEVAKWSDSEAYGFEDVDVSYDGDEAVYEERDPSEDSWDTEFGIDESNSDATGFFF